MTKTLAGHTKRVNTVKWISRNNEPEYEIISGSDDSTCSYWNLKDHDNPKSHDLKAHTSGVTGVDAIFSNHEITVASVSVDSTVRLWRFHPDSLVNEAEQLDSFQVIKLPFDGICFNVKLYTMPNEAVLLAFATDDDKIHLYCENSEKSFESVWTLTGHEDWVRGLDFTTDNGDVLLASSSQDSFIRLWRISPKNDMKVDTAAEDLIQVKEQIVELGGQKFVVTLDSVLQGHENWVYSVNWSRNTETGILQLLSSSMDKTMIIWTIDTEQGLWTEKIRVGDVGGNSLGFYGGKFHLSGKSFVGHGFQGSLHVWRQSSSDERLWEPQVINGGHYKEVKDIAWEPKGEFLFSVSLDQTTRIHANCVRGDKTSFHEIARPQIHGYDMQCIAVLSRYKFASAAEEKIVRAFQAPGNFVENFRNLSKIKDDPEGDEILSSHQKGASVPSLGLSNKAVYDDDLDKPEPEPKKFKDEYPENYFVPMTLNVPPTEEYLTQNTLWPELQKLYAHGYDLYSLAATQDGQVLASACKATTAEHAEIILWDTSSWKILQRLKSHKLTVTQMKFSSDGHRLLSVSRDRKWTMFEKLSHGEDFIIKAFTDKSNGVHERIIWTCCWSHDDKFFATGSRDGKVLVWTKTEFCEESSLREYRLAGALDFVQSSVTALAFAHRTFEKGYLLAIGFETGFINLQEFRNGAFELPRILNHSAAHHLAVNKLEFRPATENIQLASCGVDHTVRIYDIQERKKENS